MIKIPVIKFLFVALVAFGLQSTTASADWRSRLMDQYDLDKAIDRITAEYTRRDIERFTNRMRVIPTTKALSENEEEKCFQLYDDSDLAERTDYYSAFQLMFALNRSFVFPHEDRYHDFEGLNRPDRERNYPPTWLDYRAHGVIARFYPYDKVALSTPENFLNVFNVMKVAQGRAPCYFDYTRVQKSLAKLKQRVERDLEIRNQFYDFEKRVSGKSIQDLSASDIEFLNSILADTDMVLSEVRFAAYNTAGLLLIRSDDGKIFWSKDKENRKKAIYFWEYAARNGQSVDAMLNLFVNRGLLPQNRFISIASSFSPRLRSDKIGLFKLYSPLMQGYDVDDSEPTPQNTLLLASNYMRHPALQWRHGNEFMRNVSFLTHEGRNKLKKYVEEKEDRARDQYKAERTVRNLAAWAALIGTTAAAIGQLSDGGSTYSTASDLFKGQMDHIDNVMVGAYALSLD